MSSSSWAKIGLLNAVLAYAVSFVLPAYQLANTQALAGWQVFRLTLELLTSARVETGQRPLLAVMVAANMAGVMGFVLAAARRWCGSAIAALTALLGGASCLLNPRALMHEFRLGYYVWLLSFTVSAGIGLFQWRQALAAKRRGAKS